MSCARCGEHCTCSSAVAVACAAEAEFYRPEQPEAAWRGEVASRIAAHRARRRKPEDLSLPLNFEPRPVSALVQRATEKFLRPAVPSLPIRELRLPPVDLELRKIEALARASNSLEHLATAPPKSEPAFVEVAKPPAPLPPFPRVKPRVAKILAFPIPPEPKKNELADPVADQLRIFEVEAEAENATEPAAASAFAHLDLAPEVSRVDTHPNLELPLQVAPINLRVWAAAIDLGFVAIGVGLFEGAAIMIGGMPPMSRASVAAFLGSSGFALWLYYFLCLYFGRCTPGMRMNRIGVSGFRDEVPSRAALGWRASAMALSYASLALGFAWAAVDDDRLCWHDRMTRTYVRELA